MTDWVFSMSLKSSLYWISGRKTSSFFFFLKSFLICFWIKEKIYQVWLHLSSRRCSQDPKSHLYQSLIRALNQRALSDCCRQSSVVQWFIKRRVCWRRSMASVKQPLIYNRPLYLPSEILPLAKIKLLKKFLSWCFGRKVIPFKSCTFYHTTSRNPFNCKNNHPLSV